MIFRGSAIFVALALCVADVSHADPTPTTPPSSTDQPAAEPAPPPAPCDFAPVDLSLWPAVSLNARHRGCVTNLFGFALGTGRAGQLYGLQLGLVGQSVTRAMRGVQIGTFYVASGDTAGLQLSLGVAAAGGGLTGVQLALITAAGQDAHGIQLGGLGAASGDEAVGLQVGGLFAASGESLQGIQLGGLFSAAGSHLVGAQVGGLFAAAGDDLRGIQAGGLFAASGARLHGLQLAGLFGAAGELAGVQVAVGASFNGGGTGAQLAGAFNRAQGELTGVQLAVVNIGHIIDGAQIGVVNIADVVHGAQIGVVNIAQRATAPLGLVSIVDEGQRAVELWGSEAVPFAAAARFGTARVYSLLGAAGDPLHARTSWGPVGGIGLAFPLSPSPAIALELDGLGHALFHAGVDQQALLAQLRLRLRVALTDQLSIAAGPTWNAYLSSDDDGAGLPLGLDTVSHHGATTVRQWPGVTAGLAFHY